MNKTSLVESLVNTLILSARLEDALNNIHELAQKLMLRDKKVERVLDIVEQNILLAVSPENRTTHPIILITALKKYADGLNLEHPLGTVERLPVMIEYMERKLSVKIGDLTNWTAHMPTSGTEIEAVNRILADILRYLTNLHSLFQTMTEKAVDSTNSYRNAFELYRQIGILFNGMIRNHNMQEGSIRQLHDSFDQLKSHDFGNTAKESIIVLTTLAQRHCQHLAESVKNGLHRLNEKYDPG